MLLSRAGSIRLRLIGLAVACAVPLVALGIFRLSANAAHERRTMELEVQRSAFTAAERIDERLMAADALLLGLSVTLRAERTQRTANELVLQRTLAAAPSLFANVFLLDTLGTVVATARPFGATGDAVQSFADRRYFDVVRTKRDLVVGELRRSIVLADHAWVVVLARAMTDATGRFAGVVSMPVRLDSLVNVTRDATTLGTSLVTIYDTAGVVLARSNGPDSLVGQRLFPAGAQGDSSGARAIPGVDGVTRITGVTRTRTAPWIVNLGISAKTLDAERARNIRNDLLLLCVALALAITFAYVVGKRLTQPIDALVDAARAFERGEVGVRAPVSGPGEIGVLANAFNQMAQTVDRRTAALADSERQYRFLFDGNPLPMWFWDADSMQLMAVNDMAIEVYGYPRERFLSLRITDLLDPSELPRFTEARLPFSEHRQTAGTWQHRTSSGRVMEMAITTSASRRLGRPSWLSVGIDVTAQRTAERALEQSIDAARELAARGLAASNLTASER
jgi:PAS domain S-box-containing protein